MSKTLSTYQPVPPAWTFGTAAMRRRVIAATAALGIAIPALTAAAPAFAQQATSPIVAPCLPINGILPGGCGIPAATDNYTWLIEKFGTLEIAGMKLKDLGPYAETALKMVAAGLPPHIVLQRLAAVLGAGAEAYNKSVESAETKARHGELMVITAKIADALGQEAGRLYAELGEIKSGQNSMRQDFERRLDAIIEALQILRHVPPPAASVVPPMPLPAPKLKKPFTETSAPVKPKTTATVAKADEIFDWSTFRFRKDKLSVQEYEMIFPGNNQR